ncbi:MAG: hypothetical protein PHN73_05165 [Eubacteriales bacterium]|nr:hypothetical protein [Eubacteriales bacterium]
MTRQMRGLPYKLLKGSQSPCTRLPVSLLVGICLILLLGIALIANSLPTDADDSAQLIIKTDDLDGDGIIEEYCLSEKTLTVRKDDQDLWKTPAEWQLGTFSLGDVNNDGKAELIFSLWKKGSFGKIRPFWHTGKDDSYKNHLFVYKLEKDMFKPVWCSSDLDRPILSIDILDINGDGQNELVVDEGQYRKAAGPQYSIDPDGLVQTYVWKWNEWGFSLL